jgi:hypothetical protein
VVLLVVEEVNRHPGGMRRRTSCVLGGRGEIWLLKAIDEVGERTLRI